VDTNPESETYSQVVHRTPMPNIGDELHHYGWNACSSACHSRLARDKLIVPGFRSSRIHVLDVTDPREPRLDKVIEPEELRSKTGYTAPHTVHCMPGDMVTISMLGDADGNAPGGFAVLDAKDFSVLGRWEEEKDGVEYMYDFWYQPRANTLISSEWAAPQHLSQRLQPGRRRGRQVRTAPALLGPRGKAQDPDRRPRRRGSVPLEIRWQHDPGSEQGFVGAADASGVARRPARLRDELALLHVGQPVLPGSLRLDDETRPPGGRSYAVDPRFFVDFTKLDTGPARPHEIHLPGGDCTTEIFP